MKQPKPSSSKLWDFLEREFFWDTAASGSPQLNTWVNGQIIATNDLAALSAAKRFCAENRLRESDATIRAAIKGLPHVLGKVNRPGEDRIFYDGYKAMLNTWAPHRIGLCEPHSEPPEVFAEFMANLFPVAEERAYMMRWLAVVAMRPAVPMLTSVILRSTAQGVGKDVLVSRIMGQVMLGRAHFVGLSLRDIKREFNSPLAGKRLIHIEEVYSRDSLENANRLKALVTNDQLLVNQKYAVQYVSDFFGAFVVSSNDKRPLLLEETDRRWFVPAVIPKAFESSEESAQFFAHLLHEFEQGDAAQKLGQYFEHICREIEAERGGDIAGCFAVAMPTEAKKELLHIDTSYEAEDTLRAQLQNDKQTTAYQIDALLDWLNRHRGRMTKAQIIEVLKQEGFASGTHRVGWEGTTMRVWAYEGHKYAPGVKPPKLELFRPSGF